MVVFLVLPFSVLLIFFFFTHWTLFLIDYPFLSYFPVFHSFKYYPVLFYEYKDFLILGIFSLFYFILFFYLIFFCNYIVSSSFKIHFFFFLALLSFTFEFFLGFQLSLVFLFMFMCWRLVGFGSLLTVSFTVTHDWDGLFIWGLLTTVSSGLLTGENIVWHYFGSNFREA